MLIKDRLHVLDIIEVLVDNSSGSSNIFGLQNVRTVTLVCHCLDYHFL